MPKTSLRTTERRSFFSRLAAGVSAFGGIVLHGQSTAAQSGAGAGTWRPRRHDQDDWLDQLPGSHRLVFDTTSPAGFANALLYANNFFIANQNGYGLGAAEAAVVIVARHNSTPFAYNEAIWEKYGAPVAKASGIADVNNRLPNFGVTVDALIARGVHFAVCDMATRRLAGVIASAVKGNADEIYKELTSSLVRNSHMVAAGIVAVNRAQERGYTFAHGG
jgi:intracellular sulfur oxidation DsrE/DsrF family protein